MIASVVLAGCNGQPTTPEQALTERAEGRWQALVDGDFEGAYAYLAPGYREVTSYERYRGRFGAMVGWKAAAVTGLSVDLESERADVTLRLEYRAADPGGQVLDLARGMKEVWLLSDGEWYFSPE